MVMKPSARHLNRIELLQGTLDLLILQTLQWGPQHGYGISQAIRANSMDAFQVDTGSLYPALHRLAKQKLMPRRGRRPRTGSVSASTASPRRGATSWRPAARAGSASSKPWAASSLRGRRASHEVLAAPPRPPDA